MSLKEDHKKWPKPTVVRTVGELKAVLDHYPLNMPLAIPMEASGEYEDAVAIEWVPVMRVKNRLKRDGYCNTSADYLQAWSTDDLSEVFEVLLIE